MRKVIKQLAGMASLYEEIRKKHYSPYSIEELLLMQSKGKFIAPQDKKRIRDYAEEKRKERNRLKKK